MTPGHVGFHIQYQYSEQLGFFKISQAYVAYNTNAAQNI